MVNPLFPYDPGNLPTCQSPNVGEKLSIRIEGYPPKKNMHFSIRNPHHKEYSRFVALRQASSKAMAGRAPYRSAVSIGFEMHAPGDEDRWNLNDYLGGIMDTLDGSHGDTFTYLPIVFEDDCQVSFVRSDYKKDDKTFYIIKLEFL
jgi:hypothetical protein